MAKTAGGVRGSGSKGRKSRPENGKTERGYTRKMRENILEMESRYRNNKDETLHIYDSEGNIITSFGGKGAAVRFNANGIPENAILTHNHPRSIGTSGIMRIGNSFSKEDVVTAVRMNASEIRAVTPTYTFSLKRPAGGWGVTEKQLKSQFDRIFKNVYRSNSNYVYQRQNSITANQRASITTYHEVIKRLAKKYGWNYTKKRG